MPRDDLQQARGSTVRDWRAELRAAIAFHDLTITGHELVGGQEQAIERARLAAVAVIEHAQAEGVTEAELDAEIVAYRDEKAQANG